MLPIEGFFEAWLRAGEAPPPLPGAAFYFARVPEDAVPERALERLARLR